MPRWDLTAAFPSLDSSEFASSFEELGVESKRFEEALDKAEGLSLDDVASLSGRLDDLIALCNQIQDRIRTLTSFIHGFVSVDSRNDLARSKESELDKALIPFSKCGTRFTSWIGRLPLDAIIAKSQVARDHEFFLRKSQLAARRLMSPSEESLAAELLPTALYGWTKLHGQVTSQIEVELEVKGQLKRLPMSVLRTLAYEPDRSVRKAAYEAELEAWKKHEGPIAAAMNGVKGTVTSLSVRRGWNSVLDEALFASNIDEKTLGAMMQAAKEALPDFRRYLHVKARLLGLERLTFYDLFAPMEGAAKIWTYEEGARFVARHFRAYSDKLADFAERSYREKWIDAEPRPGKRDGAFCMGLVEDQSRILMNYKPSFGSVKTLAHELGHAYHNLCLAGRTNLQRRTPMTLAETASTFCETVIQNAALEEASGEEKLQILEGSLDGSCQTTVDILSRFLFEQQMFEDRAKRELSAAEFCNLMLDAQRQTYGDGLDGNFLHRYMWAVKPHYYGRSFYNFPYMYGMLFGLGLYSIYRKDPESFKVNYDELLSSTGLADAATLAERFGFDVSSPAFWRSSFDVIREQIKAFEQSSHVR